MVCLYSYGYSLDKGLWYTCGLWDMLVVMGAMNVPPNRLCLWPQRQDISALNVATNTYLHSIIIGCHRIWVVFTTLHMVAFTEFTDSRHAMYVCVTNRNTRSTRKKLTGHGLFTIVMEAAFPCAAPVPTKG